MSRRRLVAVVSAMLMLGIGSAAVGAFVVATQSARGREVIRRFVEAQVARTVRGSVHLGTLSGSFLTDLRIDSVRIADVSDSVFFASGPLRVTYDPRDIVDGRIILRTVEVDRPLVQVRREIGGGWTHEKLWPGSRMRSTLRERSRFGAVFLLQEVRVHHGSIDLLLPWAPNTAPADSITRAWRWRNLALSVPRARLAYPDSQGLRFQVARLDVDEEDPPFAFRELQGEVAVMGDTVFLDIARFALPGSVARASGRVWWGRPAPLRYDIRIDADTVALADLAWISPTLPTTGGGRMRLDIRSAPEDPRTIDYRITRMDVRAHRSRLLGDMTWGVGPRELTLRDVDLQMEPLDAALLERFNQGPLAVPMRGEFRGRVIASGGPLSRFVVEDARALFRDANVPGAIARATARGALDIREPGTPVFFGMRLDVATFDLRTAHALDEGFPRLFGTLRGSARLDSVWGNLRITEADVRHRDGASEESRLRGTARLAWDAEGPVRWGLDAAAFPLSFGALAQSFPAVPFRGEFQGPLRTAGTAGDFTLEGDMLGAAGRITADMQLDSEAPHQRLVGRATFTSVNPRVLFAREGAPAGEVTARVAVDAEWDSLANLTGSAQANIDRSVVEGARVFAGTARLRFGDGRLMIDTLSVESAALDVAARGALGLSSGITDSVTLRARADSLGGLRWWLGQQPEDTLAGAVRLDARVVGSVRDFAVHATATADRLRFGTATARFLEGATQISGLPTSPRGTLMVQGDTMRVGGFVLRDARLDAQRSDAGATALRLVARGPNETALTGAGAMRQRADSALVDLEAFTLTTTLQRWQLASPAHFQVAAGGFRVDSVALTAAGRAALVLAGGLPATGALDLRLDGRDVPVADLGELFQLEGAPRGRFDISSRVQGTRQAPELTARGELRDGFIRGLRVDTLRAGATAIADRVALRLELGDTRRPGMVAAADLPLVLGLDGRGIAMNPNGALEGRIRADSLGLEVLETLTRGTTEARGRLEVDVRLGGTWGEPRADGLIRVRDGLLAPAQLGDVRWRNVEAEVGFTGDSITIRNVSALSRAGRASFTGWVSLRERDNPVLDLSLTSRGFHAFARPGVADVDISGDLRLTGARAGATLRGALTADRAVITIPELASKDVISLEGPDRFSALDTLVFAEVGARGEVPSTFLDNLTIDNVPVRMGRDVWLRSNEANINLGGEVSITRGRVARGLGEGELQFGLVGPLQTQRGTYRLNLGPVQRTFEVEGGEIRFFGDPELNPTLDISAMHVVRQYSEQGIRPDVRVRVNMGGTLRQPVLALSTPDSLRVTNADLISYLVTGGPSFDIGGRNGDISATAARVVVGSIGSFLGGKVAGGLCDDAQVSTAGLDQYAGRFRNVGAGILAGTRFNCARQVGERAFVRLDAGLCQVGQLVTQGGGGDPLSFTDALGLKLDYLLGSGLSASIGVEPPTSAVLCAVNANASARGFVPTPRQVGFDLFRFWRF